MQRGEDESPGATGNIIGWCILAAAVMPLIIAAFAIAGLGPLTQSSGALFFLLPTPLLMLVAGIGLILRKSFGYWCAYLATFFGGIGGLKIPFVPFVQRYVNLGPETGNFFLLLNLFVVALLVWEHWNRINEMEWERRGVHRWGLIALVLAGLVSTGFGAAMESIRKGSVSGTAQLPVIGEYFGALKTTEKSESPVHHVVVHNKLNHSVDAAITGEASEEAVRALAEHHKLKPLDRPEAFAKVLPRTRKWKLQEKGFPVDFAPPDLIFIGRPRDGSKAIIQIVWRKSDSKFGAEMFGNIVPSESTAK